VQHIGDEFVTALAQRVLYPQNGIAKTSLYPYYITDISQGNNVYSICTWGLNEDGRSYVILFNFLENFSSGRTLIKEEGNARISSRIRFKITKHQSF
jgi:hypothetical protein